MKAPFNVPAINNEFEILAKILGIADDNDQERSKIGAFGKQGGVSKFKYSGEVYSVANKSKLPGVKTSYEFNGNWYSIQKEGCANHSAEETTPC